MGLQLPPAPLFLFARAQLPRGGGLPFLPPTLFLSSLPTCYPSCTGPVSSPVLYSQSSSSSPGRILTGSARPLLTRPLPPSQTPVLTPPLLLPSADWIPRLSPAPPLSTLVPRAHRTLHQRLPTSTLLQVSIPTRSLHLHAQKAPLTCSGPNRAPDLTPRRLSSISVKRDSILPGAQARSLAAISSLCLIPHNCLPANPASCTFKRNPESSCLPLPPPPAWHRSPSSPVAPPLPLPNADPAQHRGPGDPLEVQIRSKPSRLSLKVKARVLTWAFKALSIGPSPSLNS